MIDLHCDTMMQLLDHPHSGDLYCNTWKIDIEKLQKLIARYKTLHSLLIWVRRMTLWPL